MGTKLWEPVVSYSGLLARQGFKQVLEWWVESKEDTGEEEGVLLWIGYMIPFITARVRDGNGISWIKLDLLKTFQFTRNHMLNIRQVKTFLVMK